MVDIYSNSTERKNTGVETALAYYVMHFLCIYMFLSNSHVIFLLGNELEPTFLTDYSILSPVPNQNQIIIL